MSANYGENEIKSLLSKVRIFNREIGAYEMFVITENFEYAVKLSNGRINIRIEELQDDERDALTPERFTAIANRFVSTTTKTTSPQAQPQVAQASTSTPQTKKKISSGRRILNIVSVIVLALIGLLAYNQLQRQHEVDEKSMIKNNITSYVTASRSGYTYSELGGISNLSITVSNSCNYMLDNVRVKVSYIKSAGGVWKDEFVDFNYVAPLGTQTLKAPDSERGTNVEYEIVSIKSTALGLY